MENPQNPFNERGDVVQTQRPKIYSVWAIQLFSVVFTTVFGGGLLMQNLLDVGKKKEAYTVLIYSILFTIASFCFEYLMGHPFPLTIIMNMLGGLSLSRFFKQYFPESDDYERKKIWKPLMVSFIISIPFVLPLIYSFKKHADYSKQITWKSEKPDYSYLKMYEEKDTKIYGTIDGYDEQTKVPFYHKDSILSPDCYRLIGGSTFELLNQKVVKSPELILIKVLRNPRTNEYVDTIGWVPVSKTSLKKYYDAERNWIDTAYVNKFMVIPAKKKE